MSEWAYIVAAKTSYRRAEVPLLAITIIEEATALAILSETKMYQRSDEGADFSETWVIAIVAAAITTGSRASTVSLLAS